MVGTGMGMKNPFDMQRERISQRMGAQAQSNTDAIRRRFASLGNLNSGSAIKAEQLAQEDAARQREDAIAGVDAAEAQDIAQKREAELGRQFQAGEAEKQRAFGAGESALARLFQANESRLGRDFTSNENLLGRQFTAGENLLGRQFTAGENRAGRDFSAEQSAIERAFRGGEADKQRGFEAEQSQIGRTFSADQAALQRALQEAQMKQQADQWAKQFSEDQYNSKFNRAMAIQEQFGQGGLFGIGAWSPEESGLSDFMPQPKQAPTPTTGGFNIAAMANRGRR